MKVGIIGATGYVGVELLRLLLTHPKVKEIYISSVSFEGQNIESIYPNFYGVLGHKTNGILENANSVIEKSELIFTALPHGFSESFANTCLKQNKKVIDLSADFRFGEDEKTFQKWYNKAYKHPSIHKNAVYGLPEINREKIKTTSLVANPGCYVTAATLALIPAVEKKLIVTNNIIIDAKSGITGTGRKPSEKNNFSENGESFAPYGVGKHRHQPEIERNLNFIANADVKIIFTPHLLPMSRGIIATIYTELLNKNTEEEIYNLYKESFKSEKFVRILPLGDTATTRNVRLSNYCDISIHVVNEGKTLLLVSAIDNMVKGASGQAVQNMNIMYGFEEGLGIDTIPTAF